MTRLAGEFNGANRLLVDVENVAQSLQDARFFHPHFEVDRSHLKAGSVRSVLQTAWE